MVRDVELSGEDLAASWTLRKPRSPLGRWLISFVNCFLFFTAEPGRAGEELSNLCLS